MKLLLITQSRSKSGKPVQQKRTVVADIVRVGRESGSEIHLPDVRVALQEGFIFNRDGPVFAAGEGTRQDLTLTKRSVKSQRLKIGEPMAIGPYQLMAIAPPAGYDMAFSIELVMPIEEAKSDFASRAKKLDLASLHFGKRWWAWSLFLVAAALTFLIPAVKPLQLPWQQTAAALPQVTDKWWNPGPVMRSHQMIQERCEACHDKAFVRVKDESCVSCHQNIGGHVEAGLQKVAAFSESRCASCHLDHKGPKPLHKDSDKDCVACHSNIKLTAANSATQDVSDFAQNHPAFRVTLPGLREGDRVRIRQTDKAQLTERSNLKFPHSIHLDPQGVRHPDKGRVKVLCSDCHVPDFTRRTFEPVVMKTHCQECHRLEFEGAVTTRQVPHGSARDAKVVVQEFYANLALNGTRDSFSKAFGIDDVGLLKRVGNPEPLRTQVLSMARTKADKVAEELFEIRTCNLCHAVTRVNLDDGPDWQVAKIRPNHMWMPQARFDHKTHELAKCDDCHKVRESKVSADVAMPNIDGCRECHAGSTPTEKKVTSNCLLCHGFHVPNHPWKGGTIPIKPGKGLKSAAAGHPALAPPPGGNH